MMTQDVAELAQTLFEEIGDAAFIADPGTLRLVDVNPMAQRMTGRPRGELLRLNLSHLFRSSDDLGLVHLQRALRTTQTFHSQEGYFLRRGVNGIWIPVNLTLTRLHTERGPLGLVLARDVTERIQSEENLRLANATLERRVFERTAELARVNATLREEIAKREKAAAALRENEELFRGAFEHTDVAMVLTDAANKFVRVNAAFARLFGYATGEILGMTMPEITHPDDVAESFARREALLAGESSFFQMEKRYLHKDGHVFWGLTNVSLVRDLAGRPGLYVGQVQDITERKRAEESLQQSEARYRSVVEGSLHGILIKQGPRIEYANPACLRVFGYADAEELVAQPWDAIVAPEDLTALWQRAEACVRGEPVDPHPGWQGVRKDGKRIWIESTISRIWWRGQDAVLCFLADITEKKHLEEQFRQAQKMEAIGRLAGGVAHDFNNLLTIINGYGELVLTSLPSGDPTWEPVREMVAAGERAAGLTRQLLAFSRKAIVEPIVFELGTVVGNVERMLRRIVGEDIQLVVAVDPEAGAVKADPGQIEQLIMNLAVNARDAMPRGGRLTIEVRDAAPDEIPVPPGADARPDPHVLLAVTDTGCGMDDATMARMFEPFFTTKGDLGTGLGLATVYGIVRQSAGHLAVASEVGRGTMFRVYLPRAEKRQFASRSSADLSLMPQGEETILLAEDEEGVRALIRHVLQQCGYTVLEARDGPEALLLGEQNLGRIGLLLTDVVMPGMGGRDLAERLAELQPGVKVLFLSGYTDDAVVRHGIQTAEVAFLQKPFTPASLARKVREVLDEG